jgi:hypothetical protein
MKTKFLIAVGTICLFLAGTAIVGCGRDHSSSELRVTGFKPVTGLYPVGCEVTVRNSVEIVTAVRDFETCNGDHIRIGDKAELSGSDVWINGDLYIVEHAEAAR